MFVEFYEFKFGKIENCLEIYVLGTLNWFDTEKKMQKIQINR